MKTSFLNWLAAETGLKDYGISERLGQTFEDLFNELESEYGQVAAEEIDPRFVHLFLLVGQEKVEPISKMPLSRTRTSTRTRLGNVSPLLRPRRRRPRYLTPNSLPPAD